MTFILHVYRNQLEKLYIRSILENDYILWDNRAEACSEKLERVQFATARVVTGATQTTSIHLLYNETKREKED